MGKGEIRLRQEGNKDLIADRLDVAAKIGETAHMAFPGIFYLPARKPLSPPVERDDGKSPVEEFADHLVVFLDEFRPALDHADGPFGAAAFGEPIGSPQPDRILRFDLDEVRMRRNRVIGRGQKLKHGGAFSKVELRSL